MDDDLFSSKDPVFAPSDWDADSLQVGPPARWLVNQDDFLLSTESSCDLDNSVGGLGHGISPLSAASTSTPTKESDTSSDGNSPLPHSELISPTDLLENGDVKMENEWFPTDTTATPVERNMNYFDQNKYRPEIKFESATNVSGDGAQSTTMSRYQQHKSFINSDRGISLNRPRRSKTHQLAVQSKLISDQDIRNGNASCLNLSDEERKALRQEGFPIPTKLPLTKQEVEALKIVRRKIKNKLSAQESRRKRKEYVESMEEKMRQIESENQQLRQKLRQLEQGRINLTTQLEKVKKLVGSDSNVAGSKLACVFVLLFAVSLIASPTETFSWEYPKLHNFINFDRAAYETLTWHDYHDEVFLDQRPGYVKEACNEAENVLACDSVHYWDDSDHENAAQLIT